MELHSYAKLRGYKKWTIEQKRKLVEARINYDGVFSRKSSNCQDSWKKIMTAAKLNDFNVCFVRKQWANLLARYKAYKRTRLRQLDKSAGELNDQVVREISEEWEFFYPIHSFMSRKTTNFHSYAQIPHISGGSSNSITHDDDDDETPPAPKRISLHQDVKTHDMEVSIPPNTDHDFYSKSASDEIFDITVKVESPVRFVPFDSAEDTSATPNAEAHTHATADATTPSQNCIANSIRAQTKDDEKVQTTPTSTKKKRQRPSERDKYYQHKRRYDRRNERRLDAILNVFGQVIKQHYPNVDTSKLEAQSDQVSTEDDGDSTMSLCSILTESTCTAPSTAPSDDGSDL